MEKRLHLSKNRKIAGVCAGIAEYFNIDPVIVRILFIIFLSLYGISILVYLFLWISMPKKSEENAITSSNNKRFYRTRNKKIAGVCSGIAKYMETDPIIVRVIFIILTFLGMGIGIIVYLAIWISSDFETIPAKPSI